MPILTAESEELQNLMSIICSKEKPFQIRCLSIVIEICLRQLKSNLNKLLRIKNFQAYSVRWSGLLIVAERAKNGHRIVTRRCSQTSAPISPPRQWIYIFGKRGRIKKKVPSQSKPKKSRFTTVLLKKNFGKNSSEDLTVANNSEIQTKCIDLSSDLTG